MTISRYYTPSGRLIQTPYEGGDREAYYRSKRELRNETALLSLDEILSDVPDSLKFTTPAGRTVIGGGGILPDYFVALDSASALIQAVNSRTLDNRFVRQWLDRDGGDLRATWGDRRADFIASYTVPDAVFDAFVAFAEAEGLDFTAARPADGAGGDARTVFTAEELAADAAFLKTRLKARLAVRLYDRSAWYPIIQQVDRTLQQAQTLWPRAEALVR